MATLLASFPVLPSSIKYTIGSHPSFSASHPNPLFSSFPPKFPTSLTIFPFVDSSKWSNRVSFFPGALSRSGDVHRLKQDLCDAIAPLDRGAKATPKDQEHVNLIARKLEALNSVKEPLKCDLLNGKWELLYTTSQCILQTQSIKFWRPKGKVYLAFNLDPLRAQNLESWPFFNQATAKLEYLNSRSVAVKCDFFKIASLIPNKFDGSARVQIEITYLDLDLKITRGRRGNLFILKMVDPSYRVPL